MNMQTPGPGSYPMANTIFSLSILSNMSAIFNGQSSEVILQNTYEAVVSILGDSNIQGYVGTWSVVWGPIEKLSDVHRCENTMYIAYNEVLDTYAVLIAGTDTSSVTDWAMEDFNVWDKKPWPYYTAPNKAQQPNISKGAFNGLTDLTNLVDPDHNRTAMQYLQDIGAVNVCVSGHSLGGTLAPLYALYLGSKINGLNLSCVPVAALTCGDTNFVTYYNSTTVGQNTVNIANSMDFIPHLFEYTLVEELKKLYAPTIPWDLLLDPTIFYAEEAAKRNDYQQANQFTFTSPLFVPADVNYPEKPGGKPVNPDSYTGQVSCQHVAAYSYYLDIVDGFLTHATSIFNSLFPGKISGIYFTNGCSAPTGS